MLLTAYYSCKLPSSVHLACVTCNYPLVPATPPVIYGTVVLDFGHASTAASQLWRSFGRAGLFFGGLCSGQFALDPGPSGLVGYLLVLLDPAECGGGGKVGVAGKGYAGLAAVRPGRAEAAGAGGSRAQTGQGEPAQGQRVFCPGGARPPVEAMNAFIDEHSGVYGVEPVGRVLPIAPSTYREHAARRRDPSRRPDASQPR